MIGPLFFIANLSFQFYLGSPEKMWSNFHTHSNYCDGKSTLRDTVDKAKSLGMGSVGFSSHAPLPFDCLWCMKAERLPAYVDEIAELKKSNADLQIYCGLEVDYIPGIIGPKDFSDLDYTVGSVHFVGAFEGGRGWEIDGPHATFLDGLERIYQNNIREVVHQYFALTREMLETSRPDIVGHVDKIKMQNIDNKFFDEADRWYRNEVEQTVNAIQRAGCIVEVNTRGLYQKKTSTPYPSPWILQLLFEKKIPITLSSDAHHCDDLVNKFDETAELLYDIGFRELQVLNDGSWTPFQFDANGIRTS